MKKTLHVTCFLIILTLVQNEKTFGQCNAKYATLPYTQGFETPWLILCGTDSIAPDLSWLNSSDSVLVDDGQPAWRRDDYNVWQFDANDYYSPVAAFGNYSARFHSAGTAQGNYPDSGSLDLHINCSQPGAKQLTFYYINEGGSDYMNVSVSTDSGATFTFLSQYTTDGGWTEYTLQITSTSPKTVIRFTATSSYGNNGGNDIGLDSITVSSTVPCSGKPEAGTIVSTKGTCPGTDDLLSLSGESGIGITYSWQQSSDNISWSSIAGDTNSSVTVVSAVPTFYRAIVTCSASGLSDTAAGVIASAVNTLYRTIPYTQGFESWVSLCGTDNEAPDTNWSNSNPAIVITGMPAWRRDDYTLWGGINGNWYQPSSAFGNYCARFHTANTNSSGNYPDSASLNLYLNCSSAAGEKRLTFYYINGAGSDYMNVALSTDSGATFTNVGQYTVSTTWTGDTIFFSSSSPKTIIRFTGVSVYGENGGDDIGLDSLTVLLLAPCSGKPVAGTVISKAGNCATYSTVLSLSGTSTSPDLTFSWQQSSDNINWTTIAGTTSSSITVSPATSTYYRAIATCPNSGLSDTTTNTLLVDGSGGFYRKLPYEQGFESWMTRCATYPDSLDVPDSGWINIPSSGNDSWRRDDSGTAAGWSGIGGGAYSPAAAVGNHSARFHAFDASNHSRGDLNLYIDCSSVTGAKLLNFYYINPEVGDTLYVYLSTDGGNSFIQQAYFTTETSWTAESVSINSNSATTIISFVGESDFGASDMGIDEVQVITPCSGKPTAGTIVTSSNCPGFGSILTPSGGTLAGGITYTWQQSTDNANWSNIAGDTLNFITVVPATLTYYRLVEGCAISGLYDTSVAVSANTGTFYRNIPYSQGFENWITRCAFLPNSLDVPDTGWTNSPSSGNDSWRRDDEGGLANWNNSSGAYSPSSAVGNHSARFHNYNAQGGTTGTLNLYLNCSSSTGTKELSFYYIDPDNGNASLSVSLSTDGGNTFTQLEQYSTQPDWTPYNIPINSNSATTVISFVATGDDGSTDIGIDSVQISPPCQGKPSAGNLMVANNCPGIRDSLFLLGATSAAALQYTWQQSNNNVNWSTLPQDTLSSLIFTPAISSYYRVIVTCTASSLSDTTPGSLVESNSSFYRTIPYTEDFESWMTRCASYPDSLDVPDTGWTNNPSSGNNSWRRDDEGNAAGWDGATGGPYNPLSAVGNYSARFHAYYARQGETGALNLYVNCSSFTGSKLLSFYYVNPENGDSMNVYYSIDGGNSFTEIGHYAQVENWTQYNLFVPSNSATTVISFVGTADLGSYDMGLDYVQILPPCSGKPAAGTIMINNDCPGIGNSLSLSGETVSSAIQYGWQQSTDNINWNTITGDTSTFALVAPLLPTYYRAIVSCTGSGVSDTTPGALVTGLQSFYRNLPYVENFESWMTRCATYPDNLDVPDTGWTNIPADGNDSWRRDDQGSAAGWNNDNGSYSPPSAVGNHSARFHAYSANNGTTGALNLYVNCSSANGNKQLSFYYMNTENGDSMAVYYSTDGGNTFTELGGYTQVQNWTQYNLFVPSNSAATVISFVATSDDGSYDMGLDYVQVGLPCQDKPSAGTIVNAGDNCPGPGSLLSLTGATIAAGITYTWQQSLDNVIWSTIPGDTIANVGAAPIAPTYYRAILTCINSLLSDTSAPIFVKGLQSFYRNIPYTQNFESWMTRCALSPDSLDVPDTGWTNVPAIGNSSWRRDDQGSAAGWINAGLGSYSPAAAVGNHSARFHDYDALNQTTGVLSLYVNCSTYPGAIYLNFDYINPEQGDSMDVYLSTDTGNTFTEIGHYTTVNAWTQYTLPIVSNSATTIIEFVATSDEGNNDMGIDYVQVGPSIATGIQALNNNPGTIDVYPDPFNGQFTLSLNGMPAGNFNVEISNTLGQTVMELTDYSSGGVYRKPVDMHTLPAGVYFVSVTINGNGYVKKAIKMD